MKLIVGLVLTSLFPASALQVPVIMEAQKPPWDTVPRRERLPKRKAPPVRTRKRLC